MKLEHLMQTYKYNKINAELKEINTKEERAGVITFADGISASYILDKEDIVVSMKMFFCCLTTENRTISNQLSHTIKILNIMQETMMSLANIPQKECNMILEKLGLFNDTFKETKQIKHLEHTYKIETIDGLLCLSINEIQV